MRQPSNLAQTGRGAEKRRAASRRDDSAHKLRRELSGLASDARTALKGLPVRPRPAWLIQYLVDVDNLPDSPPRMSRTPRAARPGSMLRTPNEGDHRPPHASKQATTMGPAVDPKPVSAAGAAQADAAALAMPSAMAAAALAMPSAMAAADASVTERAQSMSIVEYRQEALDLFALLGHGPPSAEAEALPPEPSCLLELPPGFHIVQDCRWDDWRVRKLSRQFAAEDVS